MKLDQAFSQLGIVQDFIPLGNSNRPGTKLNVRAITIHNTDNAGKGAGAAAHAKYQKGADARKREVSWHYTVDDKAVYQSLPATEIGWHASSSVGNGSSIGVEICMNSDLDEATAYERAALLVAVLAHQHQLAVPEAIVQHNHWSGKNCPRILRERPGAWKAFLKRIGELHAALKAPSAITIKSSHHDAPTPKSKAVAVAESDAAPVPANKPVPFAAFTPGIASLHWPVVTRHPEAMVVSRKTKAGKLVGRDGRRFLADRANGARYHVGIDIFCYEGDEVIAIAAGKIVSFYPFYTRPSTGEETYALFVAHDGVVCNYGEVKANSAQAYNWKVGDTVAAGQKFARVSGTNMIHFETYVPGTRTNARWMQDGSARPASLQNPTSLLLDLATRGIRIGVDGSASAPATPPPPPATKPSQSAAKPSSYTGPLPGSGDWLSMHGGVQWRFDQRGVYTRTASGDRLWRSNGEPVTCRDIFARFGDDILRAAVKHKVNPAIIMMTIATETAFARKQGFTGPKTFRWEPHVLNKDVSASFKGSYSAGPMQTLATTVRDTISQLGAKYDLAYKPFDVAPAIKSKPSPAPAKHPLYDAATSIDLGAAEIRRFWNKTAGNPILVAAVYNAGGLYESDKNAWHLRAHGEHLDRAAEWYGDSCTVLSEVGII